MEADKTESERIDGTAQAGGPGTTIRKSADGNMGAGRKLSCDGIWARWTVAVGQRRASTAPRFHFTVGAARRPRAP